MLEEIRFEIQKLQTDEKALTKFGKTMAVVLGILTLIAGYRESGAFAYTFLLALIFLFLGILWPMSLKRFYTVWMTIALMMGFVMTKVILSLMFYTAFTIIGLIAKLFTLTDSIYSMKTRQIPIGSLTKNRMISNVILNGNFSFIR